MRSSLASFIAVTCLMTKLADAEYAELDDIEEVETIEDDDGAQLPAREKRWGKPGQHAGGDWEQKYESPDFTVVKEEKNYEKRVYPPSTWACTNMTVDTAQDPLAWLVDSEFKDFLHSNRFKTKPSSLMFGPLFRYIGGNNKGGVQIKMTMGVTTSHSLVKRDRVWGDVEEQEMCFYLEKKFQADGTEPVPEPEDKAVYIVNRPRLVVFVKKFPGWALPWALWQKNRDILMEDLVNRENFNPTLYYTEKMSHPLASERQNEVWIPEAQPQE